MHSVVTVLARFKPTTLLQDLCFKPRRYSSAVKSSLRGVLQVDPTHGKTYQTKRRKKLLLTWRKNLTQSKRPKGMP